VFCKLLVQLKKKSLTESSSLLKYLHSTLILDIKFWMGVFTPENLFSESFVTDFSFL